MLSTLNPFLGGAICTLALTAALLFLRCYRKTRDSLFLYFAISFFLQGCARAVVMIVPLNDGGNSGYVLRLLSYSLIIFAIIQKNRTRRGSFPHSAEPPTSNS